MDNSISNAPSNKNEDSNNNNDTVLHDLDREQDDNNDGDDNNNNDNAIEEKYFRDPFSAEEMNLVGEHLESTIETPLRELEQQQDGGCRAFLEYKTRRRQQSKLEENRTEQRQQRSLEEDVAIRGNPRDYQTALFEMAKQKNIIVNLGTGFGKTLIALLCIRHHFDSDGDEPSKKKKQALFLVPSVALCIQQSMVLKANLPYKVNISCHASGSTEKSRRELAESNIIVATHGAIYDLLCHHGDVFRMARFNLLVMDECHYAAGNHAYKAIMSKFYHKTPREDRPRVLGLTASPLLNVKEKHSGEQLEKMLSNLETVLDAVLVTTTTAVGSSSGSSSRLPDSSDKNNNNNNTEQKSSLCYHQTIKTAEEKDIPYFGNVSSSSIISNNNNNNNNDNNAERLLLPPARDGDGTDDHYRSLHASRRRELRQLAQLYDDLGPFAVSVYCNTLRREISRNTFERETGEEFQHLLRYLERVAAFCVQQTKNDCTHGRTDKLLALEELLEQQVEEEEAAGGTNNNDTVGLVFVERRITALALNDYFRNRLEAKKKAGGCANNDDDNNWIDAKSCRRRKKDEIIKRTITATRQPSSFSPLIDVAAATSGGGFGVAEGEYSSAALPYRNNDLKGDDDERVVVEDCNSSVARRPDLEKCVVVEDSSSYKYYSAPLHGNGADLAEGQQQQQQQQQEQQRIDAMEEGSCNDSGPYDYYGGDLERFADAEETAADENGVFVPSSSSSAFLEEADQFGDADEEGTNTTTIPLYYPMHRFHSAPEDYYFPPAEKEACHDDYPPRENFESAGGSNNGHNTVLPDCSQFMDAEDGECLLPEHDHALQEQEQQEQQNDVENYYHETNNCYEADNVIVADDRNNTKEEVAQAETCQKQPMPDESSRSSLLLVDDYQFMDAEENDNYFQTEETPEDEAETKITQPMDCESPTEISPKKRDPDNNEAPEDETKIKISQPMDDDCPTNNAIHPISTNHRDPNNNKDPGDPKNQVSGYSNNEASGDSNKVSRNLNNQVSGDDTNNRVSGNDINQGSAGNNHDKNRDSIRCGVLVRKSTHIFKTLTDKRNHSEAQIEKAAMQEWLHQETKIREVLSSLRKGEINVLIATSVVEEGVDVRACSFVAVFDGLKSTKGYIQMKGRARQQNAKFFVFRNCQEDPSHGPCLSLASAQEIEQRVHRFIRARTQHYPTPYYEVEEYPYHGGGGNNKSECLELRAIEEGRYETSNGGFVDLASSKSLINRYGLSLPIDPVVRQTKVALLAHLPTYVPNQLILPAHLPREVRLVDLPKHFREQPKKLKQQMMALMACVRLHSHGLLSDRLLPLTRTDLQAQIRSTITNIPSRPVELVTPFVTVSSSIQGEQKKRLFVYPFLQKSSVMDRMAKIFKNKGHSLAILSDHPIVEDITIPEVRYIHAEFENVSCSLGTESEICCSESELDVLSQFFVLLMDSRWRRRKKDAVFRPRSYVAEENTASILPMYYVGCLSPSGRQLDIDFMVRLITESRRSKEERIQAVCSSSSSEKTLSEPRLWAPIYDEYATYIAYGPSGQSCNELFPHGKEGVTTYQDYFKVYKKTDVPANSRLFDAQRLWVLPYKGCKSIDTTDGMEEEEESPLNTDGNSSTNSSQACKELVSVKLPQDACMEVPFANASIALLATFLPQFLHHMEICLTARSFICHCNKNFPRLRECLQKIPLLNVAQALTAKSCNEDECYERLEWLGDAVLKLVQTDSLLDSTDLRHWIEFLHEGDLSFLRSDMGCNAHLEALCKHLKIDQFILITPIARGRWTPFPLELYSSTKGIMASWENSAAASKVCADVIEALLGLVYMYGGYQTSLEVADDLQLTLPRGTVDDDSAKEEQNNVKPKSRLLAAAKAFTGHDSFMQYNVVEQAFTHPTAFHPEVSSYQKLEWIGDAVLCLAARQWIYNEFPEAQVGDMVEKEAALVANETLSFLSITSGLQRHINHRDQTLPSRIDDYVESIERNGRGLWGTDPPKVLADVVEALIGAVYVDSGFEAGIRTVEHILSTMFHAFRNIGLRGNSFKLAHPKTTMKHIGGRLLSLLCVKEEDFAENQQLHAQIWLGSRWGKAEKNGQRFVASIECLGVTLVSVADRSAYSARNRACAFIVSFLRKNPGILSRLQQCRQKIDRNLSYTPLQDKEKEKDESNNKKTSC